MANGDAPRTISTVRSHSVRRALIPAAGRGTRFLPFTKTLPKEMLPLVSTPALELVVGEASRNALQDVLVVLSAEKRQAIEHYFAPSPELEHVLSDKRDDAGLASIQRAATLATMHYVEQHEPRGLGDAVAQGERFADGEGLAVLLPDDLIDEDTDLLGRMLEVYAEHGGVVVGLIDVPRPEIRKYGCAVPVDGADPSDVVALADLIEKPSPETAPSTLAIIGRYVVPPEIFDALRATTPGAGGEIQLTDAMRRLAAGGVPTHGVVFSGKRYDTGDRLDYVRAVVEFASAHPAIGAEFTRWLRQHVAADPGGTHDDSGRVPPRG